MKSIGLVLSGGFAKGAYQIGVLKAVEELVDRNSIKMISASSVGAINAFSFINEKLNQAEQMWQKINYDSCTKFVRMVMKSTYLNDCIEMLSSENGEQKIEMYTALFNVTDKRMNYINVNKFSRELQNKFVRASVVLPPFNKPMQILENRYFDGALVDNIPISAISNKNIDCIICIYFEEFNYNFENSETDSKTIKINYQSDLFFKNIVQFKHEYIEKMISDGYAYAKSVLTAFFENGVLVKDYKEKITKFNEINSTKHWYKTCDVIMKPINNVSKKFFGEGEIVEEEL